MISIKCYTTHNKITLCTYSTLNMSTKPCTETTEGQSRCATWPTHQVIKSKQHRQSWTYLLCISSSVSPLPINVNYHSYSVVLFSHCLEDLMQDRYPLWWCYVRKGSLILQYITDFAIQVLSMKILFNHVISFSIQIQAILKVYYLLIYHPLLFTPLSSISILLHSFPFYLG